MARCIFTVGKVLGSTISDASTSTGGIKREWQDAETLHLLDIVQQDKIHVEKNLKIRQCYRQPHSADLTTQQQNGMADQLDSELLIVEVKKRPALWDSSSEDYQDENKKIEAWIEVCQSLIEGYEEKSIKEKNSIGRDVQSKWINIRDSYEKNCNKPNERKSESAVMQPHLHIVSEQLAFLNKTMENRIVADHSSSGYTPQVTEGTCQDFGMEQVVMSEKKRRVTLEEMMIQFVEYQQQKPDDDKDFLMSLLPFVKSLKTDDKLHLRMKIMKVILNSKGK